MRRGDRQPIRQLGWVVAALALALAACGSSPAATGGAAGRSPDATLQDAGHSALSALHGYATTATRCKTASSPVTCLEAADRALGNRIHAFANVLATGHGFTAPQADRNAARNAAQTLANSLEILGDAEPNQANYDRVQNTFNVDAAITQLERAIAKVDARVS